MTTATVEPVANGADFESISSAARRIGCHPSSLHRAIASGRLQAFRLTRKIFLRRGAVDALLTQGASPSEKE